MFINKSSKKHPTTILLSSVLLTSGVIVTLPAHADSSTTSKVGDVLSFAIPAAAYGSTYYMDDKEGRQQFYYSFATNVAATYALKTVIYKERPDGSDDDSFPSGHTSRAFQGASFIHKRYGLEYSIPAYIGAGFVAYSRVEADEHDVADVVAGAALGVASSMYLTKSYYDDQLHIATNLAPDYYGVSVHYNF
ncbi:MULTISPECIES: phosphatase PAP2 family protein [Psychrobacter]|uniref:phosphatase PAP2 family protein n=1 Tax=Psychrobacter TaxID=497 RepID=UPI0007F4FD03|nr:MULTISPECIES: phosphatase PAP2 family protein [Psychrobacter]OAP66344.1 phosphatidic acid phosphatase [Psychrobacter sp. SHUES1]